MELRKLFPSSNLTYCASVKNGNCYSYALNMTDVKWAWPGVLTTPRQNPLFAYEITMNFLADALRQDGLQRIREHDDARHVIAAVISEHRDFHFFRRNQDGIWSHKIGHFYASTSCQDITALTSDIIEHYPNYPTFVGYYTIPDTGIFYRPDPDLVQPKKISPVTKALNRLRFPIFS